MDGQEALMLVKGDLRVMALPLSCCPALSCPVLACPGLGLASYTRLLLSRSDFPSLRQLSRRLAGESLGGRVYGIRHVVVCQGWWTE